MIFVFLLSLFLCYSCSQGKDITMIVETSSVPFAGTDANIKIKIFGSKSNVPEKIITGSFERGSDDTITIKGFDIGYVTGMAIHRDTSGFGDDWHLDKITIKIAGQPDSIFNYDDWVSKNSWVTLTLSCSDGYRVNSHHWCDTPDVDECKNPSSCISPATCTNTEGSYFCECPNGYVFKAGSSKECQDVNECQTDPSRCTSPAQCMNSEGSFYCKCPSGYTMKEGTLDECEDIDECKNYRCDTGKSTCENLVGSYKCNCKKGYQNLDAKHCINANECSLGTDTCNKTSSQCIDTEGDFYCRCKDGFTQGINNKICDAIACYSLSTPAGSTLEPARCTQPNANIYGDKCVMKCKVGYVIDDLQHGVLTCGSGSKWEGNIGVCNPVSCPALPVISDGRIFPPTCLSTGATYKETCTYSCDSGYLLEGRSSRQCLADGTWEGIQPSCKKIVVKPWIVCPGNIKQDLEPDKNTADVSSVWTEPTSNVKQFTINPPEISSSYQFPAGETKVEWTATTSAGSASCAIYVTIVDVTPPTIHNCPKDIYDTSDTAKAVTWVEPTFSDNVKVTKVDKSHNSGDTFQLLETNVRYEVQDAKGNRNSCQFKVTLKRPPCHDPDGPLDGSKTCSHYGGVNFCQVQCPSGSEMYKATAWYWQCDNKGVWQPTETIPDCVESVKKDPNMPCEEGRIEMSKIDVFGSILHCTKCPKGMYKSSTTDCSPCPVGTYNDQQGQIECSQKCPSGTSSLPGAKSAEKCKTPCPPGKYSADGLGPNCPDCPFNTYQDQAMKTDCVPCPNGTVTVGMGAKSLAECGVMPKVTIDPLVSNIKEGESVSVTCSATGKPTPTYRWTFLRDIPDAFLGKMSQQILKNANGDVIGSRLTITDATYENTGSYECSVTNTHGSDKGIANINVEKVIDFGGSGEGPI